MKLELGKVAEFIGASGSFPRSAVAEAYSIDSRTVVPGQLFFAVRGESLDGHDFVEQALAKGAVGAVVRRDQLACYADTTKLLAVDETLVALQTLGACVRRVWGRTLIAVTGSAGKTTTKDAIAHLLGAKYKVFRSQGNLNNHFGLPLMLLRLDAAHEIAVVELGMNHAGEIAALAATAQPNEGVVTGVAPVHLENFDSLAGIARAKYELIEALPPGGTAILNADDPYVSQFGRDFHGKVVSFGLDATAQVRAENICSLGSEGSEFDLVVCTHRERMKIPLLGRHNIYNALAAAATALEKGVSAAQIVERLATLEVGDKRGQLIAVGGATVLNDCYNSNPNALNAAVDALMTLSGTRKIVVAGEMLELGPQAAAFHRICGEHMGTAKVDFVLGVRGLAEKIVQGAQAGGIAAQFVETPEQAGDWLIANAQPGDAVLLKASRGVRLERALERWQALLAAH